MTLVSHAQNFEDVILWRALKDIESGFYIDIGAQDPKIDSVSRAFYEKGWRGVHVEPSFHYAEMLRQDRPDEGVLQVAIGNSTSDIVFYEIAGTGLSTGDEEIANYYRAEGRDVNETTVPCMPLSQLLDAYKDKEIHWLKIDVEGMEASVIESWLPSPVRPWILVVESTQPLSSVPSHNQWEEQVFNLGYSYVYFDGVNRYYVSEEHNDLKTEFGLRLGVFDDIVLSGEASTSVYSLIKMQLSSEQEARTTAETKLSRERRARITAEAALEASRRELHEVHQSNHRHWQLAEARAAEIAALRASTSWRLTAPLRVASRTLDWPHWVIRGAWAWVTLKPGSRPRRIARAAVLRFARFLLARPRLALLAKRVLHRLPPAFRSRVRRIVLSPSPHSSFSPLPPDVSCLSPRAREIHAMLTVAMERRREAA